MRGSLRLKFTVFVITTAKIIFQKTGLIRMFHEGISEIGEFLL